MTSVLDGFNVCIFAYGQSGTGKTFNVRSRGAARPGAARDVAHLRGHPARDNNYQHDCFLSMIEIYNENIRDLLRDQGRRLKSSTTSCATTTSACT